MIYLQNITGEQTVRVPQNGLAVPGTPGARLTICNTVSKRRVYDDTVMLDADAGLYYTLGVGLPEGLEDGEYEYSLTQEGAVLSCGLVQIGDYELTAGDDAGSEGITINQG